MPKIYSLSEKKEIVYQTYERTFDLELGFSAAHVIDKEEKETILNDDVFKERLAYASVRAKQQLIVDLTDMTNPDHVDSASTRLKALELLGKIIYPERFDVNAKGVSGDGGPTVNIYIPDNGRESEEE